MFLTRFYFATTIALLTSGCTQQSQQLPEPDADNGGLVLPENFRALTVADSVGRARHIAVNDNGDIYVKLTFNDKMDGRGGTVGLRDLNGDGRADSIAYFGDYKDEGGSAVGVQIHNGYLYTSTVMQVLRTKLTPGKLIPENKTEVLFTEDSIAIRSWHTTKPIAFDDNGSMYIPFGGPSDAGQDMKYGPVGIPGGKGLDPSPELEWHGGVWRFDADKLNQTKKDGKKFATGLRSIVGMTWNPADKSVYAVVNGMDNFHTLFPEKFSNWQGAVLPAETLVKVTEGSDFGWPYAYYDHYQKKNVLQPAYGGDGKIVGRAANVDTPVIAFPGHWAPMDVLFYQGDQFPERYRNGAFVAFHGSTDRSPYPQSGYIVCFVPFVDGKATGTWEIFADGFTGIDTVATTSEAKYRPMGLAEGPDGSLYISDSNKGRIWRVMYTGDRNAFNESHLAAMEKRKTRSYIKDPHSENDVLSVASETEGWKLYGIYCTNCHQRNGKGDNNRFPPLAGSEYVTGDKERLIEIVMNGLQGEITVAGKAYNGLMPPFQHLDDHAMASVLTFIRSRWNNDASPVSSYEVKKVRERMRK